MNLLPKNIPARFKNALGLHTTSNRMILEASRRAGFPMPDIRKALVTINRLNLSDLLADCRTEGQGAVSLPTLSRALHGVGENEMAKSLLADALKLDFVKNNKNSKLR